MKKILLTGLSLTGLAAAADVVVETVTVTETAVPPELYRAFAAYAGVHLYTDRPAYVQRRGKYLSICAPEDGLYEINPGKNCRTVDLQNGKTIGTNSKFHLSLKKGECRILKQIEIRP